MSQSQSENEVQAYLDKYKIQSTVEEAINAAVKAGATDPNDFMATWLSSKSAKALAAAAPDEDAAAGTDGMRAVVEIPATPPGVKSRTKLGEGAVWDAEAKRLLWIDIIKGKVFTYNVAEKASKFVDTRQPIGTVVPHGANTVVGALCSGICVISLETGRIDKFLGNPEQDVPENLWNDGKCDPRGRLWVGSKDIHCERPTGALWSLEPATGEWKRQLDGVSVSNGLVWSSKADTFWYIDSPTGRIDAFDYDAEGGAISNRRPAVTIDTAALGNPDGCTIDSQDKIWVAMWDGGSVVRFDPLSGEVIATVPIPKAKLVTSCAFGGEQLDQLFVTTASCGVGEADLAGPQSNAGALFRIDLSATDIRGVPAPKYG